MRHVLRSAVLAAATASLLVSSHDVRAASSFSEPTTMDGAIKGRMEIRFDTRTNMDTSGDVPEGSPAVGAADIYTVDLEVMNSILMKGEIRRVPWLPSAILGRTYQAGYLEYDLRCMLRNPSNPSQTVTLGGWVGGMTLDGNGIYTLEEAPEGKGKLRIATESVGNIPGFVSNYAGRIQGRVPEQAGLVGLADRASKKVTKTYRRQWQGKVVEHTVQGADPMAFDNVTLAQGPLAGYPETKVRGSVDYDSEEGIWYVDLTASYNADGQRADDRYSGTIRWNEDPARAENGRGWYEVNVRLNEKETSEADAFVQASSAEEAFFSSDVTVPGFTGRVSYLDTFDGDTVTASKVEYAVNANSASKIQTMTFAKILMLMVGPFNDE